MGDEERERERERERWRNEEHKEEDKVVEEEIISHPQSMGPGSGTRKRPMETKSKESCTYGRGCIPQMPATGAGRVAGRTAKGEWD